MKLDFKKIGALATLVVTGVEAITAVKELKSSFKKPEPINEPDEPIEVKGEELVEETEENEETVEETND